MILQRLLIAFWGFLTVINFVTAQDPYEEGYFVNSNGDKISCLIKNEDWRYNPTAIDYKLGQNTEQLTIGIVDVIEFGLPTKFKYVKRKVNIDRSPDNFKDLSKKRSPELVEAIVFVKYVIESRTSLLEFKDNIVTKFFIEDQHGQITPLIYKQYRDYNENLVENQTYKSQLFDALNASGVNSTEISKVEYTSTSLKNIIKKAGSNSNHRFMEFDNSHNREGMNLKLNAGVFINSFTVDGRSIAFPYLLDFSFKNNIAPRFGFEFEYVFPFANNKWSMIIEPSFTYFSREVEDERILEDGELSFYSLKGCIGFRRKFITSNKTMLFINITQEPDIFFVGKLSHPNFEIDIEPRVEYLLSGNSVGMGFVINKFSFEARYAFRRSLKIYPINGRQDYSGINIIAGYKIF